MYVNRNAANISGMDRAFVTEDDISREKRDIAGHAHVPGASEFTIPSSVAFGTGHILCHKGMFAGSVRALGDGETGTTRGGASDEIEEK